MDHLQKYMKHYPKVTLEIVFSQFYTDLSRQDFDIMVGFPTYAPFTEPLKFRKMYEVNNIVCASPKFIKQYGAPKTGADLLKFKIIGHGEYKPNYSFPLADGHFLATATPVLYLSDFDAVTEAGLAGIGLFLTGDILARTLLNSVI